MFMMMMMMMRESGVTCKKRNKQRDVFQKIMKAFKCSQIVHVHEWLIILDDHWILTMVRTKSKIAWHFDRRVVWEGGEGCLSRGSQFAQLFCPFCPFCLFCHCAYCQCLALSAFKSGNFLWHNSWDGRHLDPGQTSSTISTLSGHSEKTCKP